MRLLQVVENDEFSLTGDLIDNIPPYAILSHTWGDDSEEVSFKDLAQGPRKKRAGYRKLRFCAKQAARDGLKHFWVDTCCIDKSNSVELQEAINSMFRWYRNATKCYVYLSDVPNPDNQISNSAWETAFRESRWFKRGWTLQELVAPKSVEFFSQHGELFGDKTSLEQEIHEITGIPISALQCASLSSFSVEIRMSWARYRVTTREEDSAYSLLGIFDIFMPLIYGEGKEKAIGRLLREINEASKKSAKTLQWISFVQHERRHHDIHSKRIPGTCLWLLQTPQFQEWRWNLHSNRYLWCHGDPGTGKTVLASSVVDDLMKAANENIGIAYFYCDYSDRDSQTAEIILASLVKQLSLQKSLALDRLQRLYQDCNQGNSPPSLTQLTEVLRDVFTIYQQIFIIVDALDECEEKCRKCLIAQLKNIETPANRIFLTSRNHLSDLQRMFSSYPQIEVKAKGSDIREFVMSKIQERDNLLELMENKVQLKEEVVSTVVDNAKEMFLLAELQFDTISCSTTHHEIKTALKTIPRSLYDSFKSTLERIGKQPDRFKMLACRILLWLSRAKRPLFLKELRHFLALRPGCSYFPYDNMPMPRTMISVCMGLVTIDSESSIVRLVHYSLQEFFKSSTTDFFHNEEPTIAESCLAYISLLEFHKGPCRSDHELETRLQQFPGYAYASLNWGHHVREARKIDMELVLGFLQNGCTVSSTGQVMFGPDYGYRHGQNYGDSHYSCGPGYYKRFTGLHVASLFGLLDAIKSLTMRTEIDVYDGDDQTPLFLAAKNGHAEAVEHLIEAGADVNHRANDITVLQAAAAGGHLEVVEMLLAAGSRVNAIAVSPWGRTALQAAAGKGSLKVVKRLLEAGAHVNAPAASNGRTALQAAVESGHIEVVEILLETQANVNAPAANEGRTAFQMAAEKGHLDIMEILLQRGADVNAIAARGGGLTALQAAAKSGHIEIVKNLLSAGANVNAPPSQDCNGLTALQAAAQTGHLQVVDTLLAAGADVNADPAPLCGWTALQAAAGGGHLQIVDKLLALGADVNATATGGGDTALTALQAAAKGGHLKVVKRLLEAQADVNAADSDYLGMKALHAAAEGGHVKVVKTLIAAHADVNAVDHQGKTALQAVAWRGHLEVVETLLAAGVVVNAPALGRYGRTALQAAAMGGHLQVVESLLQAHADVNADGSRSSGRTALQAAAESGQLEVVERLLSAGADVNAPASGEYGKTALEGAVTYGDLGVVKKLLEAGADVNAFDVELLRYCVERGYLEILDALSDAGLRTIS